MAMAESTPQLPGTRHKVIGLVSGGKDSCFNLMHCEANGHEIVAIANLKPEPGVDELDSHMYQSVGTTVLPLMAQAMELPLYTRVIKGKAVERGPEYGRRDRGGEGSGSEGDETEDLTMLLRDVMAAHPEATALSSGAILSNYQRLRIEHVCSRLGLVSLSYLWQSPQMPLLDSMLRSGIEAVLVKVAGVGLDADIVGKQLGSIQPLLRRLERQYGSHPAGEGGEYETLTLSSPLFSHRLNLTKTSVVITDPEPYCVAYLRVEEAKLEKKEGWVRPPVGQLREILGLDQNTDGLDEGSRDLMDELGEYQAQSSGGGDVDLDISAMTLGEGPSRNDAVRFAKRDRWFCASVDGQTLGDEDVGSELRRCFDAIAARLTSLGLALPIHSTHVTLLLSSMSLFANANAAYTTYFGTSPPSRATVAVSLPPGQRVRVEILGYDDRPSGGISTVGGRQALHVQGLSYWAPANIGPYSQAIIVNSRLHIAGQIPLIPASLTIPPNPINGSPYPHQCVLALQHVSRIVEVLRSKNNTGGGWVGWGESCTAWWTGVTGSEGLDVVKDAWRLWTERNGWEDVPVMFVRAKELPRGALVEFQVNLHTGRRDETAPQEVNELKHQSKEKQEDADEEDADDEDLKPVYASERGVDIWSESVRTSGSMIRGSRGIIFVRDSQKLNANIGALRVSAFVERAVAVRIYHRVSVDISQILSAVRSLWSRDVCVTCIPVLKIHDRSGKAVSLAIDIFGV